jgi:hypothetical protein
LRLRSENGLGGIKNGRLLALAQANFDVFLTADRNLSFQQNTTKFQIVVVVLATGSTQLNKPLPLMSPSSRAPAGVDLTNGLPECIARQCAQQFSSPST